MPSPLKFSARKSKAINKAATQASSHLTQMSCRRRSLETVRAARVTLFQRQTKSQLTTSQIRVRCQVSCRKRRRQLTLTKRYESSRSLKSLRTQTNKRVSLRPLMKAAPRPTSFSGLKRAASRSCLDTCKLKSNTQGRLCSH